MTAKLSAFLVGNRDGIKKWATDFGKKLPGHIKTLVKGIKTLLGHGKSLVEFLGGGRNALIAFAAVLSGPLLIAFGKLAFAMATNPFGLVIMGIAGLIYAGKQIYDNWGLIAGFFGDVWKGIKKVFTDGFNFVKDLFLDYTPLGFIVDNWKPISGFFGDFWGGIKSVFSTAWDFIAGIIEKVKDGLDFVIDSAKDASAYLSGDETAGRYDPTQRQHYAD